MNAEQFTFWLRGFFELSESSILTEKQIQIIKDNLKSVSTNTASDYVINPIPLTLTPQPPWPNGYPGVIPGINPLFPGMTPNGPTSTPWPIPYGTIDTNMNISENVSNIESGALNG